LAQWKRFCLVWFQQYLAADIIERCINLSQRHDLAEVRKGVEDQGIQHALRLILTLGDVNETLYVRLVRQDRPHSPTSNLKRLHSSAIACSVAAFSHVINCLCFY
jgi:hypothetical protein